MIMAVLRLGLPPVVAARCYGLEDRAALAAHLADKAAGRGGINLEELDAALDRIDAERLS